jgi:MoxR-like ATPase
VSLPPRASTPASLAALQAGIESVFVGRASVVRRLLVGLLAGGHVLIEDVPGVGKTTLARSLARCLGTTFHRIQFTPDLLPTDVVGASLWDARDATFVFRPGPVFAGVVLADEINRATPRTQSALLEAMGEGQVSVDGCTHPLPRPFIVVATQNPVEFEGTFPLPESQLDRFLLRLRVGYPSPEEERRVLRGQDDPGALDRLTPVMTGPEVVAMQDRVHEVAVDDALADYIVRIAGETRRHPGLLLGASPRAAAALYRASQASALMEGRDYVLPDDIKSLVVPVFSHRVVTRQAPGASSDDDAGTLLLRLLETVEPPR